jgi:ABC-2 type transport system permease protein
LKKTLIKPFTEIEEAFKKENIKLAIVFPTNFNKDLLHLNKAQVQIIADASDPNTANTLNQLCNRNILWIISRN